MLLDVEKIMDLMPLEKNERILNGGIKEGIWRGTGILESGTNRWSRLSDADGDAYLTCPITVITNKGVYPAEMLAYLGQVTDALLAEGIPNLGIKPDSARQLYAIVGRKIAKIEAARVFGVNFVTIGKYDDGTLFQIPPRDYMPLNGMGVFEFGELRYAEIKKEYTRQAKIAESHGFYTKGIVTSSGELYIMLR